MSENTTEAIGLDKVQASLKNAISRAMFIDFAQKLYGWPAVIARQIWEDNRYRRLALAQDAAYLTIDSMAAAAAVSISSSLGDYLPSAPVEEPEATEPPTPVDSDDDDPQAAFLVEPATSPPPGQVSLAMIVGAPIVRREVGYERNVKLARLINLCCTFDGYGLHMMPDIGWLQPCTVEVKAEVSHDARRSASINVFRFYGDLVAIGVFAGREQDDHQRIWITKPKRYWEMLGYLASLLVRFDENQRGRSHLERIASGAGPADTVELAPMGYAMALGERRYDGGY